MSKARIFVAIAVHDPKGGLEALPGALTSARRISAWAREHGYNVISIDDDEKKPVTIARIREELEAKFQEIVDHKQLAIGRVIIYFAGHGLVKSDQSSFWLLSDWKNVWTEAVSVQSLQRVLRFYNPGQVALIGDACRSLALASIDIVGSPVLICPDEEPQPIEIDRFFAAEAGAPAYMARGKDGEHAFCIFTEVLLDALEGDADDAFDKEIEGKLRVTSQSLGNYLLKAIPQFAGFHGVAMKAEPHPGFSTDRVYVEYPPEAQTGGAPVRRGRAKIKSSEGARAKPGSGTKHRRITPKIDLMSVQTAAEREADIRALEAERAARVEAAGAAVRSWSAASVPTHCESGCGLAVHGAVVARVDALQGGRVIEDRVGSWYRVEADKPRREEGFVDLAITFETGDVAYVCALQGFIATLAINAKGEASVRYRKIGIGETTLDRDQIVLDYIARMNEGLLTSERATSIAAEIRYRKHSDPALGCIAAYLYDSIGDIDSVRKTASYYPENGQMVPLDIALLSGLKIKMGEDGALVIDIPETKKRAARTETEKRFAYTFAATKARPGARIAGLAPWMRGGWAAVETTYVDTSAAYWRDGILDLASQVTASPFSTLKTDVIDQLAALLSGRVLAGSAG